VTATVGSVVSGTSMTLRYPLESTPADGSKSGMWSSDRRSKGVTTSR
jgi:hypothetical protein